MRVNASSCVRSLAEKALAYSQRMAQLISIKEASDTLRVSRSTVDKLIRDGVLTTVAIGRRRLITDASLRALAEPESIN